MLYRKLYTSLMVLWLSALGMAGQARAEHGTYTVYVSPVLAHWMTFQTPNLLENDFLWGARVGFDFIPTVAMEVFGVRALTEVNNVTDRLDAGITTINAAYEAYGLGVRLNFPYFGSWVPFLTTSGGWARAKFDAPITSISNSKVDVNETEKRTVWMFGTGMEIFFTRNLALRIDAQDHFINKDFIPAGWRGVRKTHNWEFGVGLTLLLGGKGGEHKPAPASPRADVSRPPVPAQERPVSPPLKPLATWVDSDGDGVPDSLDKCPGTPYGVPVDLNGCPKTLPEEYEIMCLFDFDKSDIKPEFSRALNELADLVVKSGARLSVTGYADQVGTKEYNVQLGFRRAQAVKDYLVARNVSAGRLDVKSFGEYPITAEDNPSAYYQRCVQFKLIK